MSNHALAVSVRGAMSHRLPASPAARPALVLVPSVAPTPPVAAQDRSSRRRWFEPVLAWLMLVVAIVGIAWAVAGLVIVTNDSGDRYAVYSMMSEATTRQPFDRERGK